MNAGYVVLPLSGKMCIFVYHRANLSVRICTICSGLGDAIAGREGGGIGDVSWIDLKNYRRYSTENEQKFG